MSEGVSKLERRVWDVAEAALAQQKFVSAVDVLIGLHWLPVSSMERWRQGRVQTLEQVATVDAQKMLRAVEILRDWAQREGLTASETAYLSGGLEQRELRFTDGEGAAFRIHWLSPALSPARQQQIVDRQSKAPDLVVVQPLKDWTCAECAVVNEALLIMSDAGQLCLTCADLEHLLFLPAGNAAMSRRAKKESGLAAVVVRFNARRKRYERKGILVEESALALAEEQCLADEEVRLRRRDRDRERRAEQDVEFTAAMASEIRRLFPGCQESRAQEIAEHAAVRGSGRVGRTAAAKVLDENAVTLAVIASVRHRDTNYDELLMNGVPRPVARDQIRSAVDEVLTAWRRR